MAFTVGVIGHFVQMLSIDLQGKLIFSMVIVLICYLYMIRYFVKAKQLVNVLFMMILLSIFFYYGQHIVAVFNPSYLLKEQNNHVLDGKLSDKSIISATYMAIEGLLIVFSGYVSSPNIKEEQTKMNYNEIDDYDIKLQSLKIFGWISLAISFYPTIALLMAQYRFNTLYGYLERRAIESDENYYQILGINPLFSTLSKFFLLALYALLIAYKGKKYRNIINAIVVVYFALYYLTGSRFGLVKMLITLFLVESLWINPISKSNIKKYILIGVGVAVAFTLGTSFRESGKMSFDEIGSGSQIQIYSTLWESGITFTTISNMIENCPSKIDFFYGKSVLGSVLQCLPSFLRFGFFDKYTLHISSVFSPLYYHVTNHGYGSSFIAEAYYNFGCLIWGYMFLLGKFIYYIQEKMENARNMRSPYAFMFFAVLSGSLVYGVRNDLSSLLREMLFTVGIYVLIVYFIEKILLIRKT